MATAHNHLRNLEQKGLIRRQHNHSRALEMAAQTAHSTRRLELLGQVAAGTPIDTPDGAMASSPAVDGNALVYHSMGDGHLFVLDRANGRELWSYDAGSPIESSPVVHRGVASFGAWNGPVHPPSPPPHQGAAAKTPPPPRPPAAPTSTAAGTATGKPRPGRPSRLAGRASPPSQPNPRSASAASTQRDRIP